MSHPDVFYVQYNMFNDYYMALRRSSELFVIELTQRTTSKEGTFMALLILSAISITVAMCILFPVLITVNKNKEEVLSLFLDIPEGTVKSLFNKCEQFISSLQVEDEEEGNSQIDDEEYEEQDQSSTKKNTKRSRK